MALQWQENIAGGWVDLESNRIDFNAVYEQFQDARSLRREVKCTCGHGAMFMALEATWQSPAYLRFWFEGTDTSLVAQCRAVVEHARNRCERLFHRSSYDHN